MKASDMGSGRNGREMSEVRKTIKRLALAAARKNESIWTARLVCFAIFGLLRGNNPSLYLRRILEGISPSDPLNHHKELPMIGVVMAVAEKDFRSGRLALEASIKNSANEVSETYVVVPDGLKCRAQEVFQGFQILEEREVISDRIRSTIEENYPPNRRGWITQQVIGLEIVRASNLAGLVVVDSDTFLIRPRTWITQDKVQALSFSHEFVPQYEFHASTIWGPRQNHIGMSYVTHYQLMQPEVVRGMFSTPAAIMHWVSSGDSSFKSPIADYHSYGRFLVDNFPHRFELARWGNVPCSWTDPSPSRPLTLETLAYKFPKALSVSVHSYLDTR